MTLPRTVSDVVAEHTVFEVECIDRMYLNVYVLSCNTPRGSWAMCTGSSGCRSPRPRRWAR
jgi:hypothetical protein